MFELSNGVLHFLVYAGIVGAFVAAIGAGAGMALTNRSDQDLQKVTKELVATRFALSGRTITSEQVVQLKPAIDECWKGVNVQVYDRNDMEASSFARSLENGFRDAGFNVIVGEIPYLEAGTGADLTLYLPRATGANFGRVMEASKLYNTFRSFGYSVGALNQATEAPKHKLINIADEPKYARTPEYCIVYIQPRPPARFVGPPYFGRPQEPKKQ